ncbi:MAG: PAS domain-containing sensor histidine kinase [Bacteroidales bacterium]
MFNPAFRFNLQEVNHQVSEITSSPFFSDLLQHIPITLLIINNARQVVYANNHLPDEARHMLNGQLTGRRPGECLDCIHASEGEYGCGSTVFCKVCGFADAVSRSENGQESKQECLITRNDGESLVLNIHSRPFRHAGHDYVFCFIEDISERKTKELLENIFLHDLRNTSTILSGLQQVYHELPAEDVRNILKDVSIRINEEIHSYRVITQAENKTLAIRPFPFNLSQLITEAINSLKVNPRFSDKKIKVRGEQYSICTDKTLLRQVLINLVKNALEASGNQDLVAITHHYDPKAEMIRISVHNNQVIPEEVQLQLFQKSFSTKGTGRGWGTYSIKLLTERYLKGSVSFQSDHEQGTIFSIEVPSMP